MSQDSIEEEAADLSCCACCGEAEIDDIKLVPCDDCALVKYCSDECRNNHKSEHEEACKKRVAESRDELLFKQPESTHRGDCPICSLPLPLEAEKSTLMSCCSKMICNGCFEANQRREWEMRLEHSCPFCRVAKEESGERSIERMEANDPAAIRQEGAEQYQKGDYQVAFKYYTKAARLGDVEAHFVLGAMYHNGQGVEMDEMKEKYHFEEAAIGGHPLARYNLGCHEYDNGNVERAVKHWIIAANQGQDDSIKKLLEAFKEGDVSKDELAAALRAHKAAVDETKSPQREYTEQYLTLLDNI